METKLKFSTPSMGNLHMVTQVILFYTLLVGLMVISGMNSEEVTQLKTQVSTLQRSEDRADILQSFVRLTRYDNGLAAVISSHDLVENQIYSIWWVVFNSPENCTDGICDQDDIFVLIENGYIPCDEDGNFILNTYNLARADVSIIHARDGYATNGRLDLSASLLEGDMSNVLIGSGLVDSERAEVHLVIRTQGEMIDDFTADHILTSDGRCNPTIALHCTDVQFTVFPSNYSQGSSR